MKPRYTLTLPIVLCGLAGCSMLPDWMGTETAAAPLEGTRVEVLLAEGGLVADSSVTAPVSLPPAETVTDWPQAGGNAAGHAAERIALAAAPTVKDTATAGDGNDWETRTVASPVVADGAVFVMDGRGVVSAHNASSISSVIWRSNIGTEEEEALLGGGLAYGEGKVFAVTGYGEVVALEGKTGKSLWRRSLTAPTRAAPKLHEGKLFVVSKDNQIFALALDDGRVLWKASGLGETAGYLGAASPAIAEGVVVAPYSSGELYGLSTSSGRELWQENLISSRKAAMAALLYDIGGHPVVSRGRIFGVSSSGVLAALNLRTGERIWEQRLASIQTPWLAGEWLFALSLDAEAACLSAADGRIRWVARLPRFEDTEKQKNPLSWTGPVVAGEYVWVAGAHGVLLGLSPEDGKTLHSVEVPSGVYTAPVVAGGSMYLVTRDAQLVMLK